TCEERRPWHGALYLPGHGTVRPCLWLSTDADRMGVRPKHARRSVLGGESSGVSQCGTEVVFQRLRPRRHANYPEHHHPDHRQQRPPPVHAAWRDGPGQAITASPAMTVTSATGGFQVAGTGRRHLGGDSTQITSLSSGSGTSGHRADATGYAARAHTPLPHMREPSRVLCRYFAWSGSRLRAS